MKHIRKRFQELKLWQKLLIVYLSISMIPLICITAYTTYSSFKVTDKQITTRLSELTENVSNNINKSYTNANTIIENDIHSDDFLISATDCYTSVGNWQDMKNRLDAIQTRLRLVFGESPEVSLLLDKSNYSFSPINTQIQTNKDNISFKESSFITSDRENIFIYYKIDNFYSAEHENMLLKLKISASEFIGNLSIEAIDDYIFIIQDETDKTVYMDAHTDTDYGNFVLNTFGKTDSTAVGKKSTVRIHNNVYYFHPTHLDSLGWNLCVLIPRGILYQNFSTMVGYSLLISFICLVIIGILSYIFSHKLSRRINNISADMAIISKGNLDDLPVNLDTAGDEIGQLSTLFHHMIERINSLVIDQYKNEIKSKEEQLKILQNQINPHFLYNCMDTINWRCIMNNDQKTSKFATNLAAFYRTCLNKGNTKTELINEFKNIRAYIYLQQDMRDNCFEYVEEINSEIYGYECVNLMLQPIVENALEHGISQAELEHGLIKITADFTSQEKSEIQIDVFNNGIPISPEDAEAVMQGKKGYGLTNVNNRIRIYFGSGYGITIKPLEEGTVCSINIPAKRWLD